MATKKSQVPTGTGVGYVTVNEAKGIVKCSEATIRRKLGKGTLQRYKFGGRTLILLSELLGQVRKA